MCSFNSSNIPDIEIKIQQHIDFIKNNLRNAFNQLIHTGLNYEEILQIITKKSNNSLQIN